VAANAAKTSNPALMPRSVVSIAASKPISASSSPIIDTVLANDRLNPLSIKTDPYSILLCNDIPTATETQAARNSGRARLENCGRRELPNAAAAIRYSKKIVISDTITRKVQG
jgi:hypothetical protein